MNTKISGIMKCLVACALICTLAPISVNPDPIPITLATFAVLLVSASLGKLKGSISVLLYIALGAVGVPVFSAFSGGYTRIIASHGGYIMGFLPCAFLTALIVGFAKDKYFIYPIGMLIGDAACLACGMAWYMYYTKTLFWSALSVCVVPFIVPDIVKIAAASFAAYKLRPVADSL